MPRKRASQREPGSANHATRTLTNLAQVRALADPLRLRILGVFARGPHTTKQVAEVLGEKPTRLYHHVETLARAGVIELTETRPNRGTVERYYRAAASHFHVAESLLAPGPNRRISGPLAEMVASILDSTRDELFRCAGAARTAKRAGGAEPFVARGLITGTKKAHRRVAGAVSPHCSKRNPKLRTCTDSTTTDTVTYALTIAFYPVPPRASE